MEKINNKQKLFNTFDINHNAIISKRKSWVKYLSDDYTYGIAERTVNDITNLILPFNLSSDNSDFQKWLNNIFLRKLGYYHLIRKAIYLMNAEGNAILFTHNNRGYVNDVFNCALIYDSNGNIQDAKTCINLIVDEKPSTLIKTFSNKKCTNELFENANWISFQEIGGKNINLTENIKNMISPSDDNFYWLSTNIFDTDYIFSPYCKCLYHRTSIIDAVENVHQKLMKDVDLSEKAIFGDKSILNQVIKDETYKDSRGATNPFAKVWKVADVGKQLIMEWKPTMNDANYRAIKNDLLKTYGLESGFGNDFYSVDGTSGAGGNSATASELKSKMNKQLLKFIYDIRTNNNGAIESFIKDLLTRWYKLDLNEIKENCESLELIKAITIDWAEVNMSEDEKLNYGANLYKQGIIPFKILMQEYYGVSLETANKYLDMMEEEKQIIGGLQASLKGKPVNQVQAPSDAFVKPMIPQEPANKNQTEGITTPKKKTN